MSKSGILKSGLVKKYWMAFTGLFLILFLIGHLAGNLQLLIPGYAGRLEFNRYAVFMTTNPFVLILSWLTYISIIFHAADGIVITIKNKKRRSVGYVKNKPSRNTIWSARNMGLLGTIILAFIIIHMSQFWYEYHYGTTPYMQTVEAYTPGDTGDSGYILKENGKAVWDVTLNKDGIVIDAQGHKLGKAMPDLSESVNMAFKNLWMVILYVIAMIAIAFHLVHGFQSAFQSLGINQSTKDVTFYKKYTPIIKKVGIVFSIVVPFLFAIIPVILYFR